MRKKIIVLSFALAGLLFLSGCATKTDQNNPPTESNTKGNASDTTTTGQGNVTADNGQTTKNATLLGACPEEKVSLPNYGDPGHRLKNCFVQFPGEPSRQDKSYYVVEDICGQFTKEFMENMLGAKVTKIEPSSMNTVNACSYYLDDKEYVMLNLEYLAIENQKTGNEFIGYKVEKNDKIPMDNLVAWQEDDLINAVFLVLSPNKFISLRPSSKSAISKEKFLELAANIAGAIKGYK